MCRLCAITASEESVPRAARIGILHDMLMRGAGDRQEDGWGVTDGDKIWRSNGVYHKDPPIWVKDIKDDAIWLGHVRSASVNTERTLIAAHPYRLLNTFEKEADPAPEQLFIAAHNGTIQGTWRNHTKVHDGEPNTDSWRAFVALRNLLLQTDELITPRIVEKWLAEFESSSSFCFLIHEDDNLVVIAGPDTRKLYAARMGDGFIINTSEEILKNTTEYAKFAWGVTIEDIQPIIANNYARLYLGNPEWTESDSLTYTLRAWNYNTTQSSYSSGATSAATVTNKAVTTTGSKNINGYWMKTSVRGGAKEDPETARCQEMWILIRNVLNPLREELAQVYLAMALNLPDESGDYYLDWTKATFGQLKEFSDFVRNQPLTKEHREIINAWNHKVKGAYEVDENKYQFGGSVMFWHVSNALQAINQLTKASVSRVG